MNKSAQKKGSSTIITLIGLVFFLSSLVTLTAATTNLDYKTIINSLAADRPKLEDSMLRGTLTEVKKKEKEKKEKEEKEKSASMQKKTSGAIEGCGGSTSTSGCFCTTTNCYWNDSNGNTWQISKNKKAILETVINEKNVSQSYSQLSIVDNNQEKPLTENLVYELYTQIEVQKAIEAKKSEENNAPAQTSETTTAPQKTIAPTSTTTTYTTVGGYYECLKNAASSSECKLSASALESVNAAIIKRKTSPTTATTTTQTATEAELKAQNDSTIPETTQQISSQQQTVSETTAQLKTSNENIIPPKETSNLPTGNTAYDACRKLGTVGQCSPLTETTPTQVDTTSPKLSPSQVNFLVKQENITLEEAAQLNPDYTPITPSVGNTMIFYTQTNPQWANVKITLPNGDVQDFYKLGCGDTVVASLAASFIDPTKTPIAIYQEYFSDDEDGLLGIGDVTQTLKQLGFIVIEDRKSFYNYGNSLNAGYLGLMLVSFKNYEGKWIDHFTLATQFSLDDKGNSEFGLQDPYFGELSCSQTGDIYSCKTQKGTKIEYKFNTKYLVQYQGKKQS